MWIWRLLIQYFVVNYNNSKKNLNLNLHLFCESWTDKLCLTAHLIQYLFRFMKWWREFVNWEKSGQQLGAKWMIRALGSWHRMQIKFFEFALNWGKEGWVAFQWKGSSMFKVGTEVNSFILKISYINIPRGNESTKVRIKQNKGKESENSYQKLQRLQ